MKASEIARKAAELVDGDRERTHGDKRQNMDNIATLWNAWLSIRREPLDNLTGRDVSVMMALMKVARGETGTANTDDWVDGAGYIAIAGQLDSDGHLLVREAQSTSCGQSVQRRTCDAPDELKENIPVKKWGLAWNRWR